jgi:hypothetical protein
LRLRDRDSEDGDRFRGGGMIHTDGNFVDGVGLQLPTHTICSPRGCVIKEVVGRGWGSKLGFSFSFSFFFRSARRRGHFVPFFFANGWIRWPIWLRDTETEQRRDSRRFCIGGCPGDQAHPSNLKCAGSARFGFWRTSAARGRWAFRTRLVFTVLGSEFVGLGGGEGYVDMLAGHAGLGLGVPDYEYFLPDGCCVRVPSGWDARLRVLLPAKELGCCCGSVTLTSKS